MDKRDGFLQMIEDCRNGLMNGIITQSISRFARNITETLSSSKRTEINRCLRLFYDRKN